MRYTVANVLMLSGATMLTPFACKQASLVRLPDCSENGHGLAKGAPGSSVKVKPVTAIIMSSFSLSVTDSRKPKVPQSLRCKE